MARFNNILDTIGHTPLVRVNKLAPAGVKLYVKVEAFNPMGSVKDRMAREVIERAEQSGALKPGQTVVEATSGNTGIGLAMVCAQRGYPLVVTMAENFSVERRKLLRFLGARVVLTPASEKGTGMVRKAEELADRHGYFLCRQFENEANADVHSRTTAQELLDDFAGERLDYWVSGFGTGGTVKGVARRLKADSPHTRVIVAEPDNAPMLGSGIEQLRHGDGSAAASHPYFRPHLMQGWSPDFISPLVQSAVDEGWIDQVVPVSGKEALRLSRQLACQEGIFAGISSGATLAAALHIAQDCEPGSTIVCMLPDTGERYLSTPLFEDIRAEMDAEELAISASTPACQFAPAPTEAGQCQLTTGQTRLDEGAEALVAKIIREQAVVMFALEWCEFCWSLRKLFRALNIPYESVDLDAVALQRDQQGLLIREVLKQKYHLATIPQVFIGGKHVGGAAEVFAAYQQGQLQKRLQEAGINVDASLQPDSASLLPKWLHPRESA